VKLSECVVSAVRVYDMHVFSIKLGVMEDHSNRTRLAKLLRFYSSNSDTELTSLAEYIERMKEKQEHIYFIAGSSRKEVETSPFVERLLKKGYEVRHYRFFSRCFLGRLLRVDLIKWVSNGCPYVCASTKGFFDFN